MESALASGVLKAAGDKLVSLIASEFASITGVKKDLCELQSKHQEISTWLADIATGSGTALPRVKELRNVAYDIEDLLYEVQMEAEKHKIHSEGDKKSRADCFCAKPKSFLFRCKVARKIKEIKVKYEKIVKQAGDANTIRNSLQLDPPVRSSNRIGGERSILCNVEDSKIPTRDQMKDEIITKILEPNEEEYGRPMIVSIIGLGGSGKTTLANLICIDKKIKEHFKDKIFWVHVSEEFDIKKLIGKLFQTITGEKYDPHAEEHMLKEISKKNGTNKYLLVLDDAWHNKRDGAWEKFMVHLKNGAPRSKIILTTRDRKVAEIVGSSKKYGLQSLSEAESWNLFIKSSEWAEEDLGGEYKQVGKEILKKCGGLPLAIITLGGILCDEKNISIWTGIRDSDLWTDESIKDSVYASLKLSFIHLADELKQCFTFCSIFPKGFEIHKDRLIAQWVAHGFINAKNGVQSEDVGCSYFDSLVKVGFLHDPSEDWHSKQLKWKMHDLIHDLAREIMHDEIVTPNNNMTTNSTLRSRYLSLTSCTEKIDRGLLDKVHALYICGGNPSFNKPVKKSCFVRSVTLHCTMNAPFPQFILKFEYVGYLEIRNLRSIVLLPEAISGCWNLQALIFIDCSGFVTLPESIGKLKKLRTLELRKIEDLESLPLSLGDCRDLQYLKLYYCQKLRKMPIFSGRNGSIKLLQIVNCCDLKQLPSEFVGEFSNLKTFSLASCSYFQDLSAATLSCPMLCTLDISETKVTMLPQWVTTIGTLKCINLYRCEELVELPKGIGNLKSLAVLNVERCSKLRCMPSGIGQLTRLTQLGLFVVGCGEDDARISELENLNTLSGHLTITNLMYLKDPCDAEKASLKRKNGIQDLILNWSPIFTEEEMVPGMGQDLAVLNGLEPPSDVKTLAIQCYRGPSLPRWAMKPNEGSSYREGITLNPTGSCQFLSLTELTLWQIPNLKHMRGLLVFPSLKFLSLVKMDNLQELCTTKVLGFNFEKISVPTEMGKIRSISVGFWLDSREYSNFGAQISFQKGPRWANFSGIRSFRTESQNPDCTTTTSEFDIPEELRAQYCFPVLLDLVIRECPKLSTVMPFFPPSLEELCLNNIDWQMLSPSNFSHLLSPPANEYSSSCSQNLPVPHLRELTLLDMPRSSYGWEFLQYHPELENLHIERCYHLTQLPESIRSLTSIQKLEISLCPTLGVLPGWLGELLSLRALHISYNEMIDSLPESISHLTSLNRLQIEGCKNLKLLPDEIQHLASLKFLNLTRCGALTALPESIGQLSALRRLLISKCPALECLPQSIQHLTALQSLSIYDCTALERRYKQGVGPDWHLVSHIPNVEIYSDD